MAPKGKKQAPHSNQEDDHDEPLQAVIFADSFETHFSPFTLETPRVSESSKSDTVAFN